MRAGVWHARRVETTEALLTALLGEASREHLDALFVQCLKAMERLPVDDRGQANREMDLLLELRGAMERYRRRAQELRALFETAGDLSSLRDVEGVLQAIVRRARQLLAADVAYLMLVDEDRGDTYMRVTEGTTSAKFKSIRLPMGVGLGGMVAKSMAPHWTRNYVEDGGYLHVIDNIVSEEELVAILGVPLKVGHRLVGVLFAADRKVRDYGQEEVSLLSSLADHAAIAIENASLFQDTRAALNALSSAKATIESNNQRLQRASELHERMMSLVVEGGSVQDLADALVSVMGGVLIVVDERACEIARSGEGPSPLPLHEDEEAGKLLRAAERERRPVRSRSGHGPTELVTPVIAGEDHFGALVYAAREIDDFDARSLERAATILALQLSGNRARDEADNRVRGELLAELLMAPVRDPEAVQRRGRLLGIDLGQEQTVAVVLVDSPGLPAGLRVEATAFARSMNGLVSAHSDHVVLLVPTGDVDQLARRVADRLRKYNPHLTVGAAGPAAGLAAVPELKERAHACARLLASLGRDGEGASVETLGIYSLLLSDTGRERMTGFVDACLYPVRQYDDARGTTLLETMRVYFDHECQVASAAKELFIHSNTMYQRLDRLDRLLGPAWRTGDRALELRLALRLESISK